MSDLSGQTIGKYRFLDRIGRGGMGTVYRALDYNLDREVAVKILNPELNDPEVARRFRGEAMTVAKLSHPGIATVYELFQNGDRWLMVMEFVRGQTLEHLVEGGPLSVERATELTIETLTALDHAHQMGVVHRDLKPANLMLTAAGSVKIMDFGIARVVGSEHLTTAGFMMGTPAYMAPEQVLGQEIDKRADLYAMGVVLYRLVTAKLPFNGSTPFAMAQSQVNDPPTPIGMSREGLPGWLDQVMARALSKAPEARFQSAQEFRDALKAGLAGQPIELEPSHMSPPVDADATHMMAPDLMMTAPPRASGPATPAGTGGGYRGATPPASMRPPTGPVRTPTPMGMSGATSAGMAAGMSGAATTLAPPPTPIATPMPTQATPMLPAFSRNAIAIAVGALVIVAVAVVAGLVVLLRHNSAPAAPSTTDNPAAMGAPVAGVPPAPGATQTPSVPGAPGTPGTPNAPGAPGAVPAGEAPGATQPPAAGTEVAPAAGTPQPGQPQTAPAAAVQSPALPPAAVKTAEPASTEPARAAAPPRQPTAPPPTPSSSASRSAAASVGAVAGAADAPTGHGTAPLAMNNDPLVTFSKAKFVHFVGDKTDQEDAMVTFVAGQLSFVSKDNGRPIQTLPYKAILYATFVKGKTPVWDARGPAPADDVDYPGGGLFGGGHNWLALQTKTEYILIGLDDDNWKDVIDAFETRTGHAVTRASSPK